MASLLKLGRETGDVDEATWLTGSGPWNMLVFLRGRPEERKRRLFACACCRFLWRWLTDERSRQALDVAERFADGQASRKELRAAYVAACSVVERTNPADAGFAAIAACLNDWACVAGGASITHKAVQMAQAPYTARKKRLEIENTQAALLRDIFGNPFRTVLVSSSWLTWRNGLVVTLAQAAYANRQLPEGTLDETRLSVLADALEDAGCTDRAILDHLRASGPHVRGCWVLDLLLAKSEHELNGSDNGDRVRSLWHQVKSWLRGSAKT